MKRTIGLQLLVGSLVFLPFISGCQNQIQKNSAAESSEDSRITADQTQSSAETTANQVVYEIGDLDSTPVKVYEQGWLCEADGKVGLLGVDGIWKIDPVYPSSMIIASADLDTGNQDIGSPVALYDMQEEHVGKYIFPDRIEDGGFGGVGGMNPFIFMRDPQTNTVLLNSPDGNLDSSSAAFSEHLPLQPVTVFDEEDIYGSSGGKEVTFSIWTPKTGVLHGPYTRSDYPAFGIRSNRGSIGLYNSVNSNVPTNGPFWEKADDGSYTVFSAQGTEMIRNLEYAEPAGVNTMMIRQGDKITVVDGNLKTLYSVKAESAAQPIGDVAPVQRDGKWVLERITLK